MESRAHSLHTGLCQARAPSLWGQDAYPWPDRGQRRPRQSLHPPRPIADFVCVDTEFMRESTFWPELCLIQIADDERGRGDRSDGCRGSTCTPLLDLLVNNEDVLKVFHAGGQDIEIIYNLTGKTPHPLFDTQIAAMALGQGEQIGYSNLVDSWLGIQVDKGARFTDWARRPLDDAPDRICDRRRHASRRRSSPRCSSELKQDRARRVARPGNGAARRSRQLRQRSRPGVEARADRRAASPTCSGG